VDFKRAPESELPITVDRETAQRLELPVVPPRCGYCGEALPPSKRFPGRFVLCCCEGALNAMKPKILDGDSNKVPYKSEG
jgi:hypothetical protein